MVAFWIFAPNCLGRGRHLQIIFLLENECSSSDVGSHRWRGHMQTLLAVKNVRVKLSQLNIFKLVISQTSGGSRISQTDPDAGY